MREEAAQNSKELLRLRNAQNLILNRKRDMPNWLTAAIERRGLIKGQTNRESWIEAYDFINPGFRVQFYDYSGCRTFSPIRCFKP